VPYLTAVSRPEAASEPPSAPPERGVQGLRLVLALALVGIVIYGAWQARRATELEARVELLSSALRDAQAEADARRVHLSEVRGAITEVRQSLEALEALSAAGPESASTPEAPAAE